MNDKLNTLSRVVMQDGGEGINHCHFVIISLLSLPIHIISPPQPILQQVICLYFLNHVGTKLEVWYKYSQDFPSIFELLLLPAAMLVAVNVYVAVFGSFLALFALIDAGHIIFNQLMVCSPSHS